MSLLTTVGGLVGSALLGETGGQIGKMAGQLGSSVISSGASGGGGGSGSASGGGGAASIQTAFLQDQQARLREQEKIRAGFVTKPRAQLESAHAPDVKQSIAAQVIANIASDRRGEEAVASLQRNIMTSQINAMNAPLRNV